MPDGEYDYPVSEQEIRAQRARIEKSAGFAGSARMKRFLEFTIEEALGGRAGNLKESVIGVAVFDREPGYDTRIDPIVRVEARRLRSKLRTWYEGPGRGESVVIEYPAGGYAPVFRGAAVTRTAARTLAVLPFQNLSPEADNDFFADGLTQELIHLLTRVEGLRVLAWNSAAALRSSGGQAQEVARAHAIEAMVEGSVRRAGQRVRISARLVDAASGQYLWSETYERELRDLFLLQEQIARAIVAALRVTLQGPVAPAGAGSVEAYEFYLRGRAHWNQRTEAGLRESIALFEKAIRVDERCGVAHAGLADAYALLCEFGFTAAGEDIPKAKQAARRALEIDGRLAEAHTSLAFISSLYDWNWQEGERHYQQAIALNPGYATAHHWYGVDFLSVLGRAEEAQESLETARMLDPLGPNMIQSVGYAHFLARRYEEAAAVYARLVEETPAFFRAFTGYGRVLGEMGRYAEAAAMMERGLAVAGEVPSIYGALAQIHGRHGNKPAARQCLKRIAEMSRRRHVSGCCWAIAHLGLEETDEALAWLERAAERRELALTSIGVHPAYDELRGAARFEALVAAVLGGGTRALVL